MEQPLQSEVEALGNGGIQLKYHLTIASCEVSIPRSEISNLELQLVLPSKENKFRVWFILQRCQ